MEKKTMKEIFADVPFPWKPDAYAMMRYLVNIKEYSPDDSCEKTLKFFAGRKRAFDKKFGK